MKKTNGQTPAAEEEFMSKAQKDYFKEKLLEWRTSLAKDDELSSINTHNESDVIDVASNEVAQNIELATKRREQILMLKINQALQKIEEGTYGYCEETGEPIGFARLEARPIAFLSLEAQARQEKLRKKKPIV